MAYGVKLKKYDRIVRGFSGSKEEAERKAKKLEEQGIHAKAIKLKKVI